MERAYIRSGQMLLNLHVKNLALIDECEVDFSNGLNILTGETGAGKSIIIGSINLALGGKASKDFIRDESDYALVELVFSISNKTQLELIKGLGVEIEDDQLIISRKFTNGRSISKINGEIFPVSVVKAVSEILIDIHGQHEHQSLLYKKNHLNILDEYAKQDILVKKEQLKESFYKYERLKKQIEESEIDEETRIREISFAEFEINEIFNASLKIGEDEELEKLHKRMSNSKRIVEIISSVYDKTGYDNTNAAGDLIGRALRELCQIVDYDNSLEALCGQLNDIDSLLNDFNREISDYMSDLEFSDEEFKETEERLNLINSLKSKYGKSIQDIIEYKENKEKELERLKDYEQYIEEIKAELKKAKERLEKSSAAVSKVRKKYAKELIKEIKAALVDLNFLNVEFDVEFDKLDNYTKNGYDEIQFIISTNPGEELKPLGKVASGGELSRIMLAIKTVLSDKDETETLIFDEIDVGISGRTAQMVSEKMAVIGRSHQLLCITHLPQIAAMADTHYIIEKNVINNKTVTSIRKLTDKEIISELARILGGAKITDKVIESAREMKELATRTKKA